VLLVGKGAGRVGRVRMKTVEELARKDVARIPIT